VFVKNITVTVDEVVLAAVRRHAAEHNSSVNALAREYLTNLAHHVWARRRGIARRFMIAKVFLDTNVLVYARRAD
jgi:hypothetical protein